MAKNGSGNSNHTDTQIFAGGGEMGARIRETDWSKTPLGDAGTWQESLKTAVRIMLNSRYPMFVWWGAQFINLYNDAYIPVLGKRHPEALGKSAYVTWVEIWDVIGPQADLVFYEGRSTWNEEVLLVMERNDFTEETYFTFSYSPVIDDFGKVGGVICICTEDTGKVVGRRRLQTLTLLGERTAEAETAEEACQFAARTLAENRADLPFSIIYLLDAENKNASLCETAGLEKGAPVAPAMIEIGSETDVWNFRSVLNTGKSEVIGGLNEKFGSLPAGTLSEASQQAIVLPLAKAGKSDSLAGFLVAAISPNLAFDDDYRSFTELVAGHIATAIANARALEEERKRAEALAELDRAKTEFFSNVSHEFRTPLTLMLGNLEEVLGREDAVAETEREQIETAHRNSLRLLKLVNNLLDFSRIEAGRAAAQFEPTDLARLTRDLASNFRAGIEKAGIKLTVDCPPLSQTVAVDPEMWEKIILNLLSNAFKFTHRGEIEVTLRETEAGVELQVRDTGVGIPADELPSIFQRFHRVRAVHGRTHEGTGIGLALVEELVKLHHGEIAVSSEIGKGTVFIITFPFNKSGESENAGKREKFDNSADNSEKPREVWQSYVIDCSFEEDSQPVSDESETSFLPFYPSARVLLADDNADMRGYISRLLKQNGYRVEAVSDGQEVLEKLQNADLPDLLITDVMMPRLDGFQLIEEIRQNARFREIPVIMLSARAGEESKIEGFEAGADDYLVKPFSARELLARVSSIIELSKMRRAVEAEKEKSFAVLESVADCFYALDRNFCFAYLNKHAERYFGFKRDELIGKHLLETFPAGYGTEFQTEFERAFRENTPVDFEILSPISNRWLDVHAYPSREWLLVYFRDISERKRTEEKLRESEERFRNMADHAPVMVWVTDASGYCNYLSQSWYEFTGQTPETGLGFGWLEATHSDDRKRAEEEFFGSNEKQVPYRMEFRLRRKDGTYAWAIVSAQPRFDEKGEFLGYIGSVFDISERKLAEQERERLLAQEKILREEAENANRLKDEFLATVSHELRTPLNSMLGWATMVKQNNFNPEIMRRAFEVVERNARNQNQIISDILDVSRIITGKLNLSLQPVELSAAVAAAVDTIRPAAHAKSIFLETRLDRDAEAIIGDTDRLQQIVWNLLSNAVKFTPEGGRIEIVSRYAGDFAEISVTDNGSGIEPEFLPFVFDRFRQADGKMNRRHGGLGLGLAIVRHLAELHGGSVSAHSEGAGQGSVFTVRLPLKSRFIKAERNDSANFEKYAETELEAEESPRKLLDGLKILVVDDEPDALNLTTFILTDQNARVFTAESVDEALEIFQTETLDAIVSDIGMPEKDGLELIREIKARADGQHVPTIALTAYAREEDSRRVLQAGYDAYLPKPVEPKKLIETIIGFRKIFE